VGGDESVVLANGLAAAASFLLTSMAEKGPVAS
jgi:hypothetical protein